MLDQALLTASDVQPERTTARPECVVTCPMHPVLWGFPWAVAMVFFPHLNDKMVCEVKRARLGTMNN